MSKELRQRLRMDAVGPRRVFEGLWLRQAAMVLKLLDQLFLHLVEKGVIAFIIGK